MSSSSNSQASFASRSAAGGPSVQRLYDRVRTALNAGSGADSLSGGEIQDLLALACKLYATQRQDGSRLDAFGPLQSDAGITATDGAITASALLDAVSVEVFELGMWRTWGTAG